MSDCSDHYWCKSVIDRYLAWYSYNDAIHGEILDRPVYQYRWKCAHGDNATEHHTPGTMVGFRRKKWQVTNITSQPPAVMHSWLQYLYLEQQ